MLGNHVKATPYLLMAPRTAPVLSATHITDEHAPCQLEMLVLPLPGVDWPGSKTSPTVLPLLGMSTCRCDFWADSKDTSPRIPGCRIDVTPRNAPEARTTIPTPAAGPQCLQPRFEQFEGPILLMDMQDPHRGNSIHFPTTNPREEALTTLLAPAPSLLRLDTIPTPDPLSFWKEVKRMAVESKRIRNVSPNENYNRVYADPKILKHRTKSQGIVYAVHRMFAGCYVKANSKQRRDNASEDSRKAIDSLPKKNPSLEEMINACVNVRTGSYNMDMLANSITAAMWTTRSHKGDLSPQIRPTGDFSRTEEYKYKL
ncbi:hypothetical protein Nmel_007546 [Mimus melanotis]